MNRSAAITGLAGLVVGLVAGIGGAALLRTDSASTSATTKRSTTTVAIERRDLAVSETTTGQLATSSEQALTTIGTGTITTPAVVGAQVGFGGQVARVDDMPVTLMIGSQPAWRSFQLGMTDGADVRQLEFNLAALGFRTTGMVVDNKFTAATAASIKAWETSLGLATPDGVVAAGQVAFLPTPVQISATVAAGTRVSPGDALATVRPVNGAGLQLTFTVTQEADRYRPGQPVAIVTADGASHPATITALDRVAATGGGGGAGGGGGGGAAAASFRVTAQPGNGGAGLVAGPVNRPTTGSPCRAVRSSPWSRAARPSNSQAWASFRSRSGSSPTAGWR